MSLTLVTHGYIGGVGVGSSVPQGPATIIEGPTGVDLEELVPSALLAQGIAFVPDPVSLDSSVVIPDPVDSDAVVYVPTPVQTKTYTPQPVSVEEED